MSAEPPLPPSPGKKTLLALAAAVVACLACMFCAIAGGAISNNQIALEATVVTPSVTPAPSATLSPAPSATASPTASPTPTISTMTPTPTATPSHTKPPTATRTATATRTPTRTATPTATRDTVPPEITNVTATPDSLYYAYINCGPTKLTVTANVRDNVTLAPSAALNYTYWLTGSNVPNSPQMKVTMTREILFFRNFITTYYSATVDIVAEAQQYLGYRGGSLQYWVSATDEAGNVALSPRQAVTVQLCSPISEAQLPEGKWLTKFFYRWIKND